MFCRVLFLLYGNFNNNFKRWDMYQGKRNPLRAEAQTALDTFGHAWNTSLAIPIFRYLSGRIFGVFNMVSREVVPHPESYRVAFRSNQISF